MNISNLQSKCQKCQSIKSIRACGSNDFYYCSDMLCKKCIAIHEEEHATESKKQIFSDYFYHQQKTYRLTAEEIYKKIEYIKAMRY